jgi:hypothetical protein
MERSRVRGIALIDGALGLAVIMGGHLRIALRFTFAGDRIVGVDAVADAAQLETLDVEVL